MKKLIALLMAVVMVLGLVACGSTPSNNDATTPNNGVDTTAMTAEEKALAEAEIRYAVGLLFDRNYIVEKVSQGGQVPASSFVAMGMTDADGSQFYQNAGNSDEYIGYFDSSAEAFEDNYAKAYEILTKYYEVDDKGMLVNFPALNYIYNTNEGHKAIAEYLQGALSGMGITVNLENQEWNTFLNTRKNGDYSIARNGWLADYNDPISFLDMWTSHSGNNDVQFGKGDHASVAIYSMDLTDLGYDLKVENGTWAETYDATIALIKACTDLETRYELMHRAEDLLMSTGAIAPIYFYTTTFMLDDSVEGFFYNPLGYKYFWKTTVNGATDSLSVCVGSEPDTLDPALNSAVDGATMVSHLFAGLAKWAEDENGNLTIVADCAEELVEGVANEDGTVTYTYTLKEGLKWSNGEALVAQDFADSWQRVIDVVGDYEYMFDVIKGYSEGKLAVTALDDRTLEITLNNAVAYWNELLAFPTYFPVYNAANVDEGWATDASTYVSNGAYTMTEWNHSSVITMKKNPNYHAADSVTMNELKFYLSSDDNNMLTNFKNGSWLEIDSVPTNEMASLKEEYASEYYTIGQIGTYYVCWNVNVPLLPQK